MGGGPILKVPATNSNGRPLKGQPLLFERYEFSNKRQPCAAS